MKYISLDAQKNIIGTYPQLNTLNWPGLAEPIVFDPPPNLSVRWDPDALRTDIISCSSNSTGFICSEHVYSALRHLRFGNVQWLTIRVEHGDEPLYWLAHTYEAMALDLVQWRQSEFSKGPLGGKGRTTIKAENFEAYLEELKQLGANELMGTNKVVLHPRVRGFDVFALPKISGRIFINEQTAALLEDAEFTGLVLKESRWLKLDQE